MNSNRETGRNRREPDNFKMLAQAIEAQARVLSKRTVEAQELERRRVARELHDGVNQILTAAKFRLHSIAGENNLERVRAGLHKLNEIIDNAIHETRRISHNLLPAVLHDLGLAAALRSLCNEFTERTGARCNFRCNRLPHEIDPELSLSLYRIIQEGMNNIEKHSGSDRVTLRLRMQGRTLSAHLRDNGKGFDAESLSRRKNGSGLGLHSMRERAAYHGGTLNITSAEGAGTIVEVTMSL